MITIKNTQQRYGWVAMILHWTIGVIMIGLIGLGLYMTSLPDGDDKWSLYSLHKSFGMLVFLLIISRVLWRRKNIIPPLPDNLKPIEEKLAHLTHGLLYAAMFLLPITGYIDSSAGGYKLKFFGLFDVPKVIPETQWLEDLTVIMHQGIAYMLIVLLIMHVGAAMKHHFVLKDNVLLRMLPGRLRE